MKPGDVLEDKDVRRAGRRVRILHVAMVFSRCVSSTGRRTRIRNERLEKHFRLITQESDT